MPNLTDLEIIDLVSGTMYDIGPPTFGQIAQNLQEYEVMGKWLKDDKITVDSGLGIQQALMTKLDNTARHAGMAAQDVVNIPSLTGQLNVPWRHADNHWAWERRELLMNRGKALIFKVVSPRRANCMLGFAEELEQKAWACPLVTDEVNPFGIPYYIVMNATVGFNGGAPAGHTTVAGINPTTTPAWKNYTGTYSAVGKAAGELIKVLRTAHRKTQWKAPVSIQDMRTWGSKYRCYTDEETLSNCEDVGEAQNENLGRDLASVDGTIVFKKHPIVWVPRLDEAPPAANPFYMINHDTFYPVVLEGDYLRESNPEALTGKQHNVFVVFVDLSYNFVCVDRRRNTAVYKA